MRTILSSKRAPVACPSLILMIGIAVTTVGGAAPGYAQDNFFDEEENDARATETETSDEPPKAKDDLEAGDARRVEQLGALGRKHYQNGEYEKAINAYWKAYLIFDDAVVLYNIGRSYEKLGDLERAKESYKRCLGYESLDMEVRIRIEARLKSVQYELKLLEPVVEAPPPPAEPKPVAKPPAAQQSEEKAASAKAVKKAARTTAPPVYDDRPPLARSQDDAADNDIWTSMAPVSLAAGAFALTAVTLVGALVAGLLIYRGVSAHQQVEDAKLQTDLNGTSPLTQREAAALIESGTVDKAWGITAAGASAFVFVLGSALGVSAIATAYITASE